jgi:hypothetical protein|tara:strand:+ start:203 stop:307 length:105 start_codon:yes stop_codon:yes gene_type:complete
MWQYSFPGISGLIYKAEYYDGRAIEGFGNIPVSM